MYDREMSEAMTHAGATACLGKDAPSRQLCEAIRAAVKRRSE